METKYVSITSKIGIDASLSDNKAFVSLTNNTENSTSSLSCTVVFFKNGEAVFSENVNVANAVNPDFKPGETRTSEVTCPVKYDNIEVFLDSYDKE